MHCKVINNSGMDLGDLEQHIQGMYKHFDDQIGFSRPPTLFLDSDPSNAPNTLGKTAYYDPQTFEIHVYTDGRHPKDMLRSIAHELIHHQQNLEGRLDVGGYHGEGYYLHNEALKELEQEAMLEGNHYLREYEDTLKTQENQMSLKEWKNKELFENLMGKWGIKTNILNEKKLSQDELAALEPPKDKVTRADVITASGGEELEEATETYSVDLDFMKKYLRLKGYKNLESRKEEKIKQLYTQSLFSKGLTKPSRDDLEKMGIEQVDEAEHKCPECEGKGEECKCPKNEQLDEILGVAAMAGGAAALVALIGKYVGISQEKAKKFKAYLEANPEIEENFEILKRKIEVGFKGAQSDYAKYYRKVIATKDYKEFEPKKVDEVSTAAGGVVGAPRKEELQESINSILKENKKLIKRLLK